LGTEEECLAVIGRARAAGATEIACLVDFGLAPEAVLEGLSRLSALTETANTRAPLPPPDGGAENPVFAAVEAGAAHFQVTPSVLRSLVETDSGREAVRRLKTLVVGGEALTPDLAGTLKSLNPNVFNVYGPTETTVWSVGCRLEPDEPEPLIGRPLANTQTYVLDSRGRLVGPGIPGELCVGGAGVTRGYLNRGELTADRFVPDPFGGQAGARLYRTGDRASWTADGRLRFLGRTDNQVKVRGFRIELGEIESIARRHPDVKECAARVWVDEREDARLVAYVVGRLGAAPPSADLRRFFKQKAPAYMIPNHFVALDALPLTPGGKIDRAALPPPTHPAPEGTAPARRQAVDKLTADIAGVWAEVLGVAAVAPEDDFFELGGHSLLAVKLISRCRARLGGHIALAAFFKDPTVAGMASALSAQGIAGAPAGERAAGG
jgi:acyl-CoA synthetase (AMP-forming)/AMP-acid ligase II